MRTFEELESELPRDTIYIKDGRAQRVIIWSTWNGVRVNPIRIERHANGNFGCEVGDWMWGGSCITKKTLQQTLSSLHPSFRQTFVKLFELTKVTTEAVANIGFPLDFDIVQL